MDEAHSAPGIVDVDVDAKGNVWALATTTRPPARDAKESYSCPNEGLPRLVMFDGKKWTARLCNVLGFQLQPDGSPWVVAAATPDNYFSGSFVLGRVRKGEWKKAQRSNATAWGVPGVGRLQGFAMLPPIASGPPTTEGGWDAGWLIDDLGLSWIALSGRTEGQASEQGWLTDLGDKVFAMGFGSDRSSWVYVEIDEAVLVDGVLTTESTPYLIRYSPMGDYPGESAEQVGAYPSEAASPHLRRGRDGMAPRLDVAPDGAVWLPTDDGLARFDGEVWRWYLRGRVIEDIDISEGGAVWLLANDVGLDPDAPRSEPEGTVSTYVITPEAVAAAG